MTERTNEAAVEREALVAIVWPSGVSAPPSPPPTRSRAHEWVSDVVPVRAASRQPCVGAMRSSDMPDREAEGGGAMSCKWDREAEEYLADGEPCRVDEYGDPTKHCTARRTCAVHIGRDELTCPRCIGRTRADIRWIVNLAALMPVEALSRGVNSEPANLAGPAGDPLVLSWRRVDHARINGGPIGDGIEETAPTEVLGIWQAMLSEDYGHDLPDRITLATAAAYLDRNLARVANDPEQDWALMAREIRKCRRHLESALHNSTTPERGVPCPDCLGAQQEAKRELADRGVPEDEWPKMRAPRLVREYAHWCEDEDCERMHYADDSEDRWVCPKNRAHWRTVEEYDHYLAERRGA